MLTLVPHLYTADTRLPADQLGRRPCRCALPAVNGIHDPARLAHLAEGQAEARRWAGDNDHDQEE